MAKKLDSIVELAAQKTREISANSGRISKIAAAAKGLLQSYEETEG